MSLHVVRLAQPIVAEVRAQLVVFARAERRAPVRFDFEDLALGLVGVEVEDPLGRLVDGQAVECDELALLIPQEPPFVHRRRRPHAIEMQRAALARGRERLGGREERVAVVVVENVVLGEPRVAHVEVLEDPQQQPAVLKVELAALCDHAQERRRQLDLEGHGQLAAPDRAHVGASAGVGLDSPYHRFDLDLGEVRIAAQAGRDRVLHLAMRRRLPRAVVFHREDFVARVATLRPHRTAAVFGLVTEVEAALGCSAHQVDRNGAERAGEAAAQGGHVLHRAHPELKHLLVVASDVAFGRRDLARHEVEDLGNQWIGDEQPIFDGVMHARMIRRSCIFEQYLCGSIWDTRRGCATRRPPWRDASPAELGIGIALD